MVFPKECPFCGYCHIDSSQSFSYTPLAAGYRAICPQCTALGSLWDTEENAIVAWNRRSMPNTWEHIKESLNVWLAGMDKLEFIIDGKLYKITREEYKY